MDQMKPEDMKNSIDSLLSTLKCPVCLLLLEEDSVLCVNGHAICKKCKRDQTTCPTCRNSFSNLTQNIIVRQVLENIPHICRYEKCSSLVKPKDDHENFCRHRPTQCKYPTCQWVGSADNIAYHLEDTHHVEEVLSGTKSLVQISRSALDCNVTQLFSACNHYFWQMAKHDPDTEMVSFTYYPLFLGKPTRDIYVRIWFKSEEKEYDVGAKIKINPNDNNAQGDSLSIPSSVVSNFYNGNELKYKLFIGDDRSEVINMLLE